MNHFLTLLETSPEEIRHVLEVAAQLRQHRDEHGDADLLRGKTLAMYFEKPSLRTRVSFEQAMYELGGRAIVFGKQEVGLGVRETVADFTRVMNGMVDGIMARVYEHAWLEEMAEHAQVPIVNALSDHCHPCQALADIMTMQDDFGEDLSGRSLVFVGDGNNVARSLAAICAKLGIAFTLACPAGYELAGDYLATVRRVCPEAELRVFNDPRAAVEQTDAIYCDTFVSMGQEEEKKKRLRDFAGFQVNEDLLAAAQPETIVLHCLPAYRGVEITNAVMDGPASRVFGQSHNRLHAQKGLLAVLMGQA